MKYCRAGRGLSISAAQVCSLARRNFTVARLDLLYALEIGRQLVRCFHIGVDLRVTLPQIGLKLRPQLRWEHTEQPVGGGGLHLLVGVPQRGVVILDGGGHITGDNLGGIVIECRHSHPARVKLCAKALVGNQRQRVSQHGHLMGVFLNVLCLRVLRISAQRSIYFIREIRAKKLCSSAMAVPPTINSVPVIIKLF